MRAAFLAAELLVVVALGAPAATAADPRLAARLDSATAAAVGEVVEEARAKGLPSDPLVARALEGASRQAQGPRIVAAVKNLAGQLESAREALGRQSTPAELMAGAVALAVGVPPDTLARLRASRPEGAVVVPLVVLTDLVTRNVPLETASAAVLAATRAQVRDRDLMRLRERIDHDIRSGASPGGATVLRTRSLIGRFEGPAAAPRSGP
jgi:hypothetical protein